MSPAGPTETHFQGPVYGVVQGDHNTVTLVFEGGASRTVPFLAPPPPPQELFGRQQQQDEIRQQLLAASGTVAYALYGLPGVGKTSLALTLAHDQAVLEKFSDGVLWAGLGRAPEMLPHLTEWGSSLGISPADLPRPATPEHWARAIHAAIGMRRMLLVVDDAWTARDALAFELGGPKCAHLLTTRFPDIARRFAGRRSSAVAELRQEDGMALLADLAPEVVESASEEAAELVRQVAGLPLALILIGRRLGAEALGRRGRLQAALERLRSAEQRLQVSEEQGPLERHPGLAPDQPISLAAVIGFSYDWLPVAGRSALGSLTVFPAKPSSYSDQASLAVLDGDTASLDDVVDAGLVEPVGDERLTMHQTIRDFAEEKGRDPAAGLRMLQFFSRLVEDLRREEEVSGVDPHLFDRERDNILAALDIARAQGRHRELVQLMGSVYPMLERRGLYDVAERYLRHSLEAVGALGDRSATSTILLRIGTVMEQRGDLEQAEAHLRRGMDSVEPGTALEVELNLKMGWVVGMRGDPARARGYFDRALERAGELDLLRPRGAALQGLGWLTGLSGDYPAAADRLRESLEAARATGDLEFVADVLQVLGWMSAMGGDYGSAAQRFGECLELARKVGQRSRMIDALQGLGWVEGVRGNHAAALEYFEEGLAVAREVAHRERAALLLNIGWMARETGDPDRARKSLLEALELAREAGQPERISHVLNELGRMDIEQGNHEAAEADFQESLSLARSASVNTTLVAALHGLAELAVARGDAGAARRYGEEARSAEETAPNATLRAMVLATLGDVELLDGDPAAAEQRFTAAAGLAATGGAVELEALSLFGAARAAQAGGHEDDARRLGERSRSLLERLGSRRWAEVDGWLQTVPGGA